MPSKEQLAHDLSLIYLANRYGIDVNGYFSVSGNNGDISGSGDVKTAHLPDVNKVKKTKVGTGEKGFLGIEKKKWVSGGYVVDDIFVSMISDYRKAYLRFIQLLDAENPTCDNTDT